MLSSLAVLFLVACKGEVEDTDVLVAGTGGDDDCGLTDPTIQSMEVLAHDMSGDECGSESFPRIRLAINGHDEDGDLTYWEMRSWWDTGLDGVIDTAEPYSEVYGSLDGDLCEVKEANLGLILCVTGNQLEFETDYEFGVLLFDVGDNASDEGVPAIATFKTPARDGTYAD